MKLKLQRLLRQLAYLLVFGWFAVMKATELFALFPAYSDPIKYAHRESIRESFVVPHLVIASILVSLTILFSVLTVAGILQQSTKMKLTARLAGVFIIFNGGYLLYVAYTQMIDQTCQFSWYYGWYRVYRRGRGRFRVGPKTIQVCKSSFQESPHVISCSTRWNLTNVFPGLESREFGAAFEAFRLEMDEIEHFIQSEILPAGIDQGTAVLSALVQALIQRMNHALRNAGTLRAYLNSFVSTDSYNNTAMRLNSEYEQVGVRLQKANIQVINWIGKIASAVPEIIQANPTAQAHAFYLNETIEQSHYQMSPAEEALAAELEPERRQCLGKNAGYGHLTALGAV